MSEFEVSSTMQRHDLHKFHGLGNDFLLWFRPEVPDNASTVAASWCNRSTGFGADGLIIAIDRRKDAQFVLFNANGGRAEISGNGMRCFVHAVARRRGHDALDIAVETDAGTRSATISDALQHRAQASVSMGRATAGPEHRHIEIPAGLDVLSVDTVDVGNPHIVIGVDNADAHDMAVIGPQIEAQFMPTGINVHLVSRVGNTLHLNIWERGAGVTAACGSGACAAASVAHRSDPDTHDFAVSMPGGQARVQVGEELVLTGSTTYLGAIVPVASH